MRNLQKLLPDAPLWFLECRDCQSIPSREAHVLNWKRAQDEKQLEGSLWDWCGRFFQYEHFELKHNGSYSSNHKKALTEERQRISDLVRRAVQVRGGKEALCAELDVKLTTLKNWIHLGTRPAPELERRLVKIGKG